MSRTISAPKPLTRGELLQHRIVHNRIKRVELGSLEIVLQKARGRLAAGEMQR
jgi:hypothetical protein